MAKLVVIPDANIWISQRLFKSSLGVSFLYALRSTESITCLPNIIEAELIKGIVSEGNKAASKVEAGYVTLQAILGSRPDYDIPKDTDFVTKVRERITELGSLIVKSELSFDQHKAALNRVIQGIPPSKAKEQFRDCLIWEVVLQMSLSTDVSLITDDSDFYIGRDPAPELLEEAEKQPNRITFHRTLESFLDSVKSTIPLPNYDEIAGSISSALQKSLSHYSSQRKVLLGRLKDHSIEAYLTENTDLLSVSFELEYSITTQEGLDGVCLVKGSASYNLSSKLISSPELGEIAYFDAQRNTMGNDLFSYVIDTIGTRTVPYKVRKRLGDEK